MQWKPMACIVGLSVALLLGADDTADRADIDATIELINSRSEPAASLFTADVAGSPEGASQIAGLEQLMSLEPLSEVTAPKLAVRAIHFVVPGIALVEAENVQYGSMIMKRAIPVLLVMRKTGSTWRIVSFKIVNAPRVTAAG